MRIKLLILALVMITSGGVWAVSISPEIVEQLRAEGRLNEIVQLDKIAREMGVWEANPEPYRFGITADVDTLHCLIILVDFEDMRHENGFHAEPENFDTLLFSYGVNNPGSMTDYYFETSYGQALLIGQVTNWYRMPQTYAYYVNGQRGFGNYPRNAQHLTEDAVLAADPDIDFSIYDNDGNGVVDGLFVVHAGAGYEDTGNLNFIHSHAWVTSYRMPVDGVEVYRYSMEPEETGGGQLVRIGVFCHEFGHVLGLPDLYDYDYDSNGVGMWTIMAGGSWGGGGATPVHFDAWCKYDLGWISPTVVTDPLYNERIDAVEYEPDVYQLFSLGIYSQEFFMVENRRREKFDVSIPGDGLLIYHVDESVPNNNDQTHYKVAVEQADGELDLEHNRGADNGDPWPGSTDNRTFDDFSTPSAWLYFNGPSEVAVSDISLSDSSMYADLSVEYILPYYQVISVSFTEVNGNNNGRPEPGETLNLIFSARNSRAQVNDLVVIGDCSNPAIVFSDSVSDLGIQPLNTPFDNEDDPIVFTVPSDFPVSFVEFSLNFTALNGDYQQEIRQVVVVGFPDILLVDDDGGLDEHAYYTSALNGLGEVYDLWDVSSSGSPAGALGDYPMAIWFTGDARTQPMPDADVTGIISYLSGGGRLLLSSQDIVQRLSERGEVNDLVLLHDYLKVDYETREPNHLVTGLTGSVFEGMQWLTAGSGGAGNQISQDALTIIEGGIRLLEYGTGRIAGAGAIGAYAVVTIGFGIEGIYDGYNGYNTREDILEAAMDFLMLPTSVEPEPISIPRTISLDQNYPNPFNGSTMISFYLPEDQWMSIAIYDLLGREIGLVFEGEGKAGENSFTWDSEDMPSGVYFYRLTASEVSYTRRMTLLK